MSYLLIQWNPSIVATIKLGTTFCPYDGGPYLRGLFVP